jgi:hypothetical protein
MDEQRRRDKTGLRSEPEIIPPGRRGGPRRRGKEPVWISVGFQHGEIRLGKSGVFGILLGLLAVVVVLAAAIAVLAGLLLFWIPIVGLIFAVFALSGLARRRRPRGRHRTL